MPATIPAWVARIAPAQSTRAEIRAPAVGQTSGRPSVDCTPRRPCRQLRWLRSEHNLRRREISDRGRVSPRLLRDRIISPPCTVASGMLNVTWVIFPRCSGILLHVSSLPGGHGIGDLGKSAYEFLDFLAESGPKIWQVLPLSPTGFGDSPYQCFSAFAGNPLFIDLQALQEQGLLSRQDLASAPDLPH